MSDQFPSNAHHPQRGAPPRQKQKALVKSVQVRKKPILTRIHERGTGIFKDVLYEVIGPYFRDMFADAFHRGVDEAFYFNNPNQSHYRGPRPGSRPPQNISASGYVITDYNAQYQPGAPQSHTYDPRNKPFDFSQYTFTDYAIGREIIDRLNFSIHSYGRATVNDLYELLNLPGTGDHTGENYGWEGLDALASADIRRVRGGGGYYLDIPDAKPLSK